MTDASPVIAVLGASGLIGHAVADGLIADGFAVVPVARRVTASQRAVFGSAAVICPIARLTAQEISDLLATRGVDIVVNCLGVLQDGPRGTTTEVHRDFVERLLDALARAPKAPLLVHLSIPGRPEDDRTAFSTTKRDAERLIAASSVPFAILRPGFVIAPAAYGGSAMIRSLAAWPLALPASVLSRPFAATAVADITRTVALLARRRTQGASRLATSWDLCGADAPTLGRVIDAFRHKFGGPDPAFRLPLSFLHLGARVGDVIALLGWAPPIRSTALREMLRGVEADPTVWAAELGVAPTSLDQALAGLPATIQERWFSRLYLAKGLVIGCLSLFWLLSGLIALSVAFDAAAGILISHGWSPGAANVATVVSSVADISVGVMIAWRRTCAAGLLTGIAVSVSYMLGAAILTPDLWLEPLGALVKTGPAIVLMGVAYAILEDRG